MKSVIASDEKLIILFLPSIGQGLGIGNVLRCLTIASVLRTSADSIFNIPETFAGLEFFLNHQFSRTDETKLRATVQLCDAIVFDHQGPIRATLTFKTLRKWAPHVPIIAMDYFYRDDTIDVLIKLSGYHETDCPKDLVHCDYYEGLDYAIIRPEFQRYRPPIAQITNTVNNVLITFGGEDRANWTIRVLYWLERCVKEELDVQIILGALNKKRPELEEIIKDNVRHEYQILDHLVDIEQYMHKAEIVFCSGGTTIMELAYLGKAAIALPQNDMERFFLECFEKCNYILPGLESCFSVMSEEPAIRLFRDSSKRLSAAKVGMKLIDGKGPSRIADIILKKADSYRKKRINK